jgi:[acyl-carrier-protein] S-malonyltransferase
MSTAFLYPGQGSQRVGMGAELRAERPDLFHRYLGAADQATGLPISDYCLNGPLEDLTRTEVAQPALFATSLALTAYARDLGLEPTWVAGHSLGEYTAAVAAGTLSYEDGLRLVAERGRAMSDVQRERPGGMAAISGLPLELVQHLCDASGGRVVVANLNSPVQVVVSGAVDALIDFVREAVDAGAEQAVRLNVGAAFHSPFMAPVRERVLAVAMAMVWKDPVVPLVSVLDGRPLVRADHVRASLIEQVTGPVRWLDVVRTLVTLGRCQHLEIGPGRVLTGLGRQVDPDIDAFAADSPARIRAFAARLGGTPPSLRA